LLACRHRRCVRGRRPLPRTRPAGLHDYDRLVPRHPPGDPGESAGIRNRLEVGENDIGLRIIIPIEQQIVRSQVDRVADRYEAAHAERGSIEHGERGKPKAPRLRDKCHAAGRGEGGAEGRVEPGLGTAVEQPHAVRPDESDPGGSGSVPQVLLEVPPLCTDLGESGRDHTHSVYPEAPRLVDNASHERRWHGHDHEVWPLRTCRQVRTGGYTLHGLMVGVHRIQGPVEAAGQKVGEH
jgi:hypothetical protein